jgi:hypothetical protein
LYRYNLVANACQTIAVKFQETMRFDSETIQKHVAGGAARAERTWFQPLPIIARFPGFKRRAFICNLHRYDADITFDKVCVLKMESLVLKELEWSLNSVVPQTYIPRLLTLLGFHAGPYTPLYPKL